MRPSDSTTGVKFRPTPNFLNWIWYWQFRVDGIAGEARRDRKFAAGQEVRGFAGDRGEVRLGQRADHAGALHRAQRRVDRRCKRAGDGVGADQRLAEHRERIGVVEVEHRAAAAERAAEIDAELLDDVALHFGDGDLEHHLVAAAHGDAVDHLVGRRRPAGRRDRRPAALRSGSRPLPDSTMPSPRPSTWMSAVRQRLLERRADAVEVARHRDIEADDLLAVGIEEEHVGLADRDADDVGAARGADDRVGDLRVGHQHVLDVARQVDDHRSCRCRAARSCEPASLADDLDRRCRRRLVGCAARGRCATSPNA